MLPTPAPRCPSRRRAGFTLIEMLIVVTIVGMLSATAISDYRSTKKTARLAAAKVEVRRVAEAAEAYHARHGVYPADVPYNTAPAAVGSGIDYQPAQGTTWGLYYRTGDGQGQDAYIRATDHWADFLCHMPLGTYAGANTVVCITYPTF